jgi:hypothetical protein
MAYCSGSIDPDSGWSARVVEVLGSFPNFDVLTTDAMGIPDAWAELELWHSS